MNDWILDFACCFYMCTNKKLFNNYKSCTSGDLVMANGSKSKVIKKFTVKMTYDGSIRNVCDVRFIHDLRKNLISLSILNSFSYNFFLQKMSL